MIALIRTEFTKAAVRTRSLVIALLLIGLPTLIVVAINARSDRPRRGDGDGLFRLASQSGLLVPAAVLSATSGLLLIIITGTFAGDSGWPAMPAGEGLSGRRRCRRSGVVRPQGHPLLTGAR